MEYTVLSVHRDRIYAGKIEKWQLCQVIYHTTFVHTYILRKIIIHCINPERAATTLRCKTSTYHM